MAGDQPTSKREQNPGNCCVGGGVAPDGKTEPPNPANADRGCTDILFLLIWIAFWVGMVVVAALAFDKGDITELFYFINYLGKKCGQNGLGKYTYFTHPTNSASNICVDSCPGGGADSSGLYTMYQLDSTASNGYTTSQASESVWTSSYSGDCLSDTKPPTTQYGVGPCGVYGSTAPKGLYICVPDSISDFGSSASSAATDALSGYAEEIKAVIADLIAGWWILLVAAGGSLVVSFIWVQLLKYCAGCFVWTVILGSVLITAAMSYMGYYLYDYYKDEYDDHNIENDRTLAYTFLVLCGIFGLFAFILLCMVICLCKKIRIAIGIVKEACEAVTSMPLIVLYPLCQYAAFLIFLAVWIVVAGYLASTGTVSQSVDSNTNATTYSVSYDTELVRAMCYHLFGLLWTTAFLRHFTICVIAGAVGGWYWTPYIDGDKKDLPLAPVVGSVWRTFRYHQGTIAFGSFIIAVIEAIQLVIEYIKRKYLDENACLKCIASYIQCCLECFKRIMEFLSRHAYIITACKGKNFCTAAWEAFNFILDNLTQIAAVNWISMYLMFLGKVFIVLGTVVICYICAVTDDDISSVIVLLVVCGVIAYSVACMFLSVFETGIDTILMCFMWEASAKGSFIGGYVYATDHLNCFIEGINVDAATDGDQRAAKEAFKEQQTPDSGRKDES